jgi:hypothetical protein
VIGALKSDCETTLSATAIAETMRRPIRAARQALRGGTDAGFGLVARGGSSYIVGTTIRIVTAKRPKPRKTAAASIKVPRIVKNTARNRPTGLDRAGLLTEAPFGALTYPVATPPTGLFQTFDGVIMVAGTHPGIGTLGTLP